MGLLAMKNWQSRFLPWVKAGLLGLGLGFLVLGLEFSGWLSHSRIGVSLSWLLDVIGGRYDSLLERLIRFIGRHLGVQYGSIPYFPNRGVELFLETLEYALPVLAWFFFGVLLRMVLIAIRRATGSPARPSHAGPHT